MQLLDLDTLKIETPLEEAWANWSGFVTIAPSEAAHPPKLRLAPGSAIDPISFSRDHTFTAPIQSLGCHFIRDVHFAGLLYPFKDGALLDDGSHMSKVNAEWMSGYPTHRPGMRGDTPPMRLQRPVLAVAGPGCATFGHWIIDFLPRLAVAQAVLGSRFKELKFLVLDRTPNWAMTLLETFFGIKEDDCIRFELGMDEFFCSKICYPTYAHSYPFLLHSFVPKFYRSHFPAVGGERKLCVTRRVVANRAFDRRDDFEALARLNGFEIVDPAALSIVEQATLFGSAAVIIGEYGSALHNCVFSAADTIVGVVNAPGVEQTRLCAVFGQPILYMPGQRQNDDIWTLTDCQLEGFFSTLAEMEDDRRLRACEGPESEQAVAARLGSGPFYVDTIHGSRLRADCQTGELCSSQAEPFDRSQPVIAYVPAAAAATAYLMSAVNHGQSLRLTGEGGSGPILPLRLSRERVGIAVGFCHPLTGLYLCAAPPARPEDRAAVVADRLEQHGYEIFVLVPVSPSKIGPALSADLRAIDRISASWLGAPAMMHSLWSDGVRQPSSVTAAALLLLPRDGIKWLSDQLLNRPEWAERLSDVLPLDPFCSAVIPALSAWHRDTVEHSADPGPRRPTEMRDAAEGMTITPGRLLNRLARQSVPPVKGLCVLVVARDRGHDIVGWIAHHRSIGVDEIFLYSRAGDPNLALYTSLDSAGWIRLVIDRGGDRSGWSDECYRHALSVLPDILDYRWTLVMEADDYLMFDRHRFLDASAFLNWLEVRPTDAVTLNLLVFGSSGERCWSEASLTSRCSRRYPWTDGFTRTIFRTRNAIGSTPNHPLYGDTSPVVTRTASGTVHEWEAGSLAVSAKPEATTAWINRYLFKSLDEFIWEGLITRKEESGLELAWNTDRQRLRMFLEQYSSPDFVSDLRALDFASDAMRLRAEILGCGDIGSHSAAAGQRFRSEVERIRAWALHNASTATEDPLHEAVLALLN